MRVPLGRSGWYFCNWNDPPPADTEYREFQGSETYAQQWLGRFRQDPSAMSDLHYLWSRSSSEKLTDDEVVRTIAWWLRTGRVKARQPLLEIMGGGAVAPKESPFPLVERPQSSSAAAGSDPSTLPPDADAAAIAEVLKDAAHNGTPFCEECAKAAANAA